MANPDEGRLVGHYWLRDAARAPNDTQREAMRRALPWGFRLFYMLPLALAYAALFVVIVGEWILTIEPRWYLESPWYALVILGMLGSLLWVMARVGRGVSVRRAYLKLAAAGTEA